MTGDHIAGPRPLWEMQYWVKAKKVVVLRYFLRLDLRLGSESCPAFSFPSHTFKTPPDTNPYALWRAKVEKGEKEQKVFL